MITGPVLVFVDFANSFYCAKISFYRKIKKKRQKFTTINVWEFRVNLFSSNSDQLETSMNYKSSTENLISVILLVLVNLKILVIVRLYMISSLKGESQYYSWGFQWGFQPLNFVREKHNNNNNNISNSPQRQFFPLLFHLQPTKQRRKSRNCSNDGERPPVSDEVSYSSKTHEWYAPAIP